MLHLHAVHFLNPLKLDAVKEAHSKHMTICAHAEGRLGIHYAILAGVDSVEHGFYVSDEDIELMKKFLKNKNQS